MLVVTRHDVPEEGSNAFLAGARAALQALATQPGYRGGRVGRATDEPTRWLLTTEWDGVGAYRRALSSYDVRVAAAPLLGTAYHEPSAFEVVVDDRPGAGTGGQEPGRGGWHRAADADVVGLGEAAAPVVPTDLD